MKPDKSQTEMLKQAGISVESAKSKLIFDAAIPHWGIRERILKKAKALLPVDLSGPYREYWEGEVALIVATPVLYDLVHARCKKVENEILKAGEGKSSKQRQKVLTIIKEKGPVKLVEKLWPDLVDLRYEYYTESALKMLQRADLYKNSGPIFEDSPILTFAFQYAMAIDDLNFFARVGDVLRKRQDDLGSVLSDLRQPALQEFLLKHWAAKINGIPALCNLSMLQLADACRANLNNNNLSDDAIEKTRQRLGLKTFRRGTRK